MRIGEVADKTGVPARTIRFWESVGLLPEPMRTSAGYRDYEPTAVDRLAFIRQAQTAGFRLKDIRQVLEFSDAGEPACEHVRALIEQRLLNLDLRITELQTTRDELVRLRHRAEAQDPAECRSLCKILTA